MIALSVLGSATLLFSCGKDSTATVYDYETLMTESSENRTIIMMDNGKRSYTFTSPLMEGYSLATNPYQEFRRGIEMVTFTDSLSLVDATITANYAIYYERQKLWEAKGNVVIIKRNRKEGDTIVTGLTEIYTQQLFWNATTKKIYSNVDTKVLQPDGWHFGVGFDADEDLKNIHFRKYSSEVEFDMSQPEPKSDNGDNKSGDKGENKENKENKLSKDSKRGSSSDAKRDKMSGGTIGSRNTPQPNRPAVTRPSKPTGSRDITTSPTSSMRTAEQELEQGPNTEAISSSVPSMGVKRENVKHEIKSDVKLNVATSIDDTVPLTTEQLNSK